MRQGCLGFVGLLCVLLPLAYFWGFSVDDALIISKVASCLQLTGQAAFNCSELRREAVTPFGFSELIASAGSLLQLHSSEALFQLARLGGAVSWLASLFVAYKLVSEREQHSNKRPFFFLLVFICLPGAAWATAGLSGPYCGLLLITSEWLRQRSRHISESFALIAVVALRPELLPFVLLHTLIPVRKFPKRSLVPIATIIGFFAISLLRVGLSGSAFPLAFYAKAPAIDAGLTYAWGSIWFATPLLAILLQRKIYSTQAGRFGWSLIGFCCSLIFVGGDWMPLFRLSAPVFPLACVFGAVHQNKKATAFICALPSVIAASTLVYLIGSDSRAVLARRFELIHRAEPHLHDSKKIAAVDIGWVSLASSAHIFDLAGVTDARVAHLPGGHTSKLITQSHFEQRGIDTWVIRLARPLAKGFKTAENKPETLDVDLVQAYYTVDRRLLRNELSAEFTVVAEIPVTGLVAGYAILKKVSTEAHQ